MQSLPAMALFVMIFGLIPARVLWHTATIEL